MEKLLHYTRATIRGVCLILLLMAHIAPLMIRPVFKGFDIPFGLKIRQLFVKRALWLLGVKVEMETPPPQGAFIFVGNHRSYLDPIVVLRNVPALPVAKAEVAAWPLIGYGAKSSGVMFVKRESKSSRAATLDAMEEVLRKGFAVLVYPEGTTHILPHTMEFRAGAFNLAVREGVRVVPMAIEYKDLGDAWIGKDTFIPHFLRCFGKKHTFIKIRYGTPMEPLDAVELRLHAQKWVDEQLPLMRQSF
jgi:1-acyl-sn-glycerol-3-phosphate acyltransferase